MSTKPTLVILAAGMGSRYGGLKQIDPIDAAGHKIIDFSIYDALRAGFGKVVFIIKKGITSFCKRKTIKFYKGFKHFAFPDLYLSFHFCFFLPKYNYGGLQAIFPKKYIYLRSLIIDMVI